MRRSLVSKFTLGAVGLVALSGCVTTDHQGRLVLGAPPQVLASFDTVNGDTLLRQYPGGGFDLAFPRRQERIPLPADYQTARLLGSRRVGGESVVIIEGSRPGCPLSYTMVMVGRGSYYTQDAGDCRTPVSFEMKRDGVLAVQNNADDPLVWYIGNGKTAGPLRYSAVFKPAEQPRDAQRGGKASREARAPSQPRANQERRDTPPRPRNQHPDTEVAAAPPPPVQKPAPRRLGTVGDDVLPEIVQASGGARTAPTITFDQAPAQPKP